MRSCDIRLSQATLLVLIVAATGCGKAALSASPGQARVAVAGLASATGSTTEAAPGPASALTAAGAFPMAPGTPGSIPPSGDSAAPGDSPTPGAAGQDSSSRQGDSSDQGAARPIPGTDAAIQRWFLDNEGRKVKFNDALLRAERAVAGGDAAGCRPLDAAARALSAALPALGRLSPAGQQLAATMQAPLTTFAAAAAACLANDFAAARNALDSGVVQQADAQQRVDEILDGDG